jgi:hypothetical protein
MMQDVLVETRRRQRQSGRDPMFVVQRRFMRASPSGAKCSFVSEVVSARGKFGPTIAPRWGLSVLDMTSYRHFIPTGLESHRCPSYREQKRKSGLHNTSPFFAATRA